MARRDKKGDEPPPEDMSDLSALQLCDLLALRLGQKGEPPPDLGLLRERVAEMEEMQDEARSAVEQLSAAVDKLRSPALRIGTFLQELEEDRALVCVGGTDYVCNVDPGLP